MSASIYDLSDNVALYGCLGVTRNATTAEISRAFRKLAAKCHPDKNPNGEAKFKEVSFAHRVLTDPEQRRLYDERRLGPGCHRKRDPACDLSKELTTEELRSFVTKLLSEERRQAERERSFAEQQRDEYARRQRYDSEHPGFAMPELPSIQTVRSKYGGSVFGFSTTAELRAKLNKRVEDHSAALSKYHCGGLSCSGPPPSPPKQQRSMAPLTPTDTAADARRAPRRRLAELSPSPTPPDCRSQLKQLPLPAHRAAEDVSADGRRDGTTPSQCSTLPTLLSERSDSLRRASGCASRGSNGCPPPPTLQSLTGWTRPHLPTRRRLSTEFTECTAPVAPIVDATRKRPPAVRCWNEPRRDPTDSILLDALQEYRRPARSISLTQLH
eukprot:TRINITY_DN19532_c0_g1_i1.p1 TRINITY_DN19532_c0_g1~~TRINITY_DN19532_c0_g1_i1.p1  ORF type:complete len:384 (+),score=62.96 TRINITY_DN19532_c0_g1_i1:64-1215(+)